MLTPQLAKQFLAEQLPERIKTVTYTDEAVPYNVYYDRGDGHIILETEWQQIALWVEEKMTEIDRIGYIAKLWKLNPKSEIPFYRWNQDAMQNEIWWWLTYADYTTRATAMKEAGIFEKGQTV